MTLAEELAEKHGFGTKHPAFRAAINEALERAAQEIEDRGYIYGGDAAKRIRSLKGEPTC